MGKRKLTLADLKGVSPGVLAGSPELQAALGLKSAPKSSPGAPCSPSEAPKGVTIAEKVKKPPEMTQTEREYEAMLRREHPEATILFERYTLKLSNDCRYTPDFAVIRKFSIDMGWSGEFFEIDFHEVKGAFLFKGATKSSTHTSLTKPKLAAELFPWHRFFRATKAKDGTWSREEYKPAT